MNKDELKDRVVNHARNWRRAQKDRIGAQDFNTHREAKDKEHFSKCKLQETVDLLENELSKEK